MTFSQSRRRSGSKTSEDRLTFHMLVNEIKTFRAESVLSYYLKIPGAWKNYSKSTAQCSAMGNHKSLDDNITFSFQYIFNKMLSPSVQTECSGKEGFLQNITAHSATQVT